MEFTKRLIIDEENIVKVVQFHEDLIPSDVLERLDGKEEFVDTDTALNEKIYSTAKILELLEDEEDDTNETTKERIRALYDVISDYAYLHITKI